MTLLKRFWPVILCILLFGCGPDFHLRRAAHHIKKATEKGAKVKVDTVYKTITFKAPAINFSTTLRPINVKDTMIMRDPKTGAKTKLHISLDKNCPDSCIREVYIDTSVPEQEIDEDVPIAANTTVSSPRGWLYWALWISLSSLVCAIAAFVYGYHRGKSGKGLTIRFDKPPDQ